MKGPQISRLIIFLLVKIKYLVANVPELHLNTDFCWFLSCTVLPELCHLSSFNQGLSLSEIHIDIEFIGNLKRLKYEHIAINTISNSQRNLLVVAMQWISGMNIFFWSTFLYLSLLLSVPRCLF